MAGGGGGGGDKRSANAELNLVPYIDLLSTLICFLLITAVWQQIEALSTSSPQAPSSESSPPTPPDPNKIDLSVSLYTDRVEMVVNQDKTPIPFINGNPDYSRILEALKSWKTRWPERRDLVLHSDSQAPYKHLIGLMDLFNETEFPDVGVNTN